MKEKRRDSKGRILHTGESQRTDGKYLYKYVDAFGNTKYVYAWRLTPTDPTPKGKREKPSLRELEQQIRRDIEDGIDSTGKKMTLCQLYAKQNAQRANVKKSTQKQREQLMRLLKEDKLGARSIDTIKPSDAKEWALRMKDKGFSYNTINNHKRSLKASFYIAIQDDCVRKNPFDFKLSEVLENDTKEKVFRGKYLDELKSLWNDSKLKFHGTAEKYQNSYRFKELLDKCYEKNWVTYCKETFNGAQSVINYLGKYTHRIAISNHRIKSMTDTTVTYVVKDYKNEGCWKEKTISGEEFIRRFMMHVPPKRFVRIRHYGLLSCRNKRKKITHCRNLLGCKKYISTLKNLNAVEMIRVLYHIDVCKCSSCGGNMVSPRKDKYSSSFRAHMRC
jgi:hypothetical protein